MKNPFERQGEAGRHLKIAVSGPTGAGKTCFGLDAKNHGLGPVAVISLEAGDVLYEDSKRWGGFKPLRTQSIAEMREAIDFLEANPGTFSTLVVDTITGIYEAVVDSKMKDDGSMNKNTWGVAKRAWKSIMLRLVNLPLHVVFVVHEQDITETDKDGNTKIVGQKLDAEKTFVRAPDFHVRMVKKGAIPVGTVLKVRGEDTGFVIGQTINDPHLGMFVAAIRKGAETRIALPEDVRADNDAATAKAAKEVPTEPRPQAVDPAQRLNDELSATTLTAACMAGFRAEIHRKNWLAKHKAEIEELKARAPDLYAKVREAFEKSTIAADEPQEQANAS